MQRHQLISYMAGMVLGLGLVATVFTIMAMQPIVLTSYTGQ